METNWRIGICLFYIYVRSYRLMVLRLTVTIGRIQ